MPKHILVVDDEPFVLKILTRQLVAHGYVVLSATGGSDLMAKLATFKPDVILLDVMMPGLDGIQIAEQLARGKATAQIPIIFLSALISPYQPQDSPANPRFHYLGKPFEPETLLKLLGRIGV